MESSGLAVFLGIFQLSLALNEKPLIYVKFSNGDRSESPILS